ncbi:MAG TPA: peptidoglycan-binding protein [Chloroflexota bacterium]|nr:peptidoglycan-binding protein [Chloroflexota bacterium]
MLVALIATGGGVVVSNAQKAPPAAQERRANTAQVQRGTLSAMVSVHGTLTYRARSDGAAYSAINQSRGTYTALPEGGDTIGCGDVLYRVDDNAVLLLCGAVPAYRGLRSGDAGNDVRQLNQNLHALGYDTAAGVDIAADDAAFTSKTERALRALQQDRGLPVTGRLELGDAVFQPDAVRVAQVTGELGGPAQPGARVLYGTSDTPEVQVNLEPSQRSEVKEGDRAQITLPGNHVVTGTVGRLGRAAQAPPAQQTNGRAGAATIAVSISLDEPANAGGLDTAPVQVSITTRGVENALSVPVTALVGKAGGGFVVELVRPDGRRELVPVKVGLFDTAGGRVQVEGDLREGDQVVVPLP